MVRVEATLVIGLWLGWFLVKLRAAGAGWWLSPFLPASLFLAGLLVVIWLPS